MLTERILNDFTGQANQAYQQFCVWMYANNEFAKNQNDWNQINNPRELITIEGFSREKGCKYKNFWGVTISSLQHSWVLSVARLFDPAFHSRDQKRIKPRLSFEYILGLLQDDPLGRCLKKRIEKYEPTIKSIKEMRDNLLAHKDLNTTTATIKAGIEDLFKELDRVISDIKQSKPHLNNCNSINLRYTDLLSRCGVDEVFEALLRSR